MAEERKSWMPIVSWIAQVVIAACICAAFGQWQYQRGFDRGADAAICAFAIAIDGEQVVKTHRACRQFKNPDFMIEGFENGPAPTIRENGRG